MEECAEQGKLKGIDIIKNGMRWIKLLDDYADDIEYFAQDEEDREEIDKNTLKEYQEMQIFRKKHPKTKTEKRIKEGLKKSMYNNKGIPLKTWNLIKNYKKIYEENNDLFLE